MNNWISLYRTMQENDIYLINEKSNHIKATTLEMYGDFSICVDYSRIETLAEETSIIAHELGHCMTGTTHKVNSPLELISKHEYKAKKWAVHTQIPKETYINAIGQGCTEIWDLATFFGVTEEFIQLADYIYTCEGKLDEYKTTKEMTL